MSATVLHVIPGLSSGGGGRAALTAAVAGADHADVESRIASLRPAHPWMLEDSAAAGIEVLDAPPVDRLLEEMAAADLVQLHYWNTPEVQELLERDLPPIRLLLWSHVAGHTSPQLLPPELIASADLVVATSRLNARVIAAALEESAEELDPPLIPPIGGWKGIEPLPSSTGERFVIGYLGTVGFTKMATDFAELCGRIQVPDARFVVCGTGDAARYLPGRVAGLGMAERFEFRDHVREVGPVLAEFDVLGYPLRPDSSGTSDLVVKEAMYAGVPPVVLPYAGCEELVDHGRTGLIVRDAESYARAIEHLHDDAAERERLGSNARTYAQKQWSPEVIGPQWRSALERVLAKPKRERPAMIPAPSADPAGAGRFLRCIGSEAGAFRASLEHSGASPIPADEEIGRCHTTVGLGEGGLLDFGRRYPEDALLALWSGLYLGDHHHRALAAGQLSKARELGCPPERIAPHLERMMAS